MENQLFRVGQMAFIIASGEATTMSGRRWRNAVSQGLIEQGILSAGDEPWIVLGGPANSYGHYVRFFPLKSVNLLLITSLKIATPEEYVIQRYEGASTLYGKYT